MSASVSPLVLVLVSSMLSSMTVAVRVRVRVRVETSLFGWSIFLCRCCTIRSPWPPH
jgi:hypothetical protein